ncbi:MAG: hypothetical protein A2V88_07380 [Elusimicrobia bacterium RBG_16_66_12]|nr:MAG: hypothetical protein A2V88_07380 [Elusimicrobia bacterium RBG_16_66_12]
MNKIILRKRVPVKLVIESFQQYRMKLIDIVGLAQNLSTAMSLLEGDIPKPVRDSIVWAEAQIDSIRFGINERKEPAEVAKVWRELEEVITRHDAPGREDEEETR